MPWKKLRDVPGQVKKHKGASLTLAQANYWASVFDATGNAAIAWSQFTDKYRLEKGRWVRRKK